MNMSTKKFNSRAFMSKLGVQITELHIGLFSGDVLPGLNCTCLHFLLVLMAICLHFYPQWVNWWIPLDSGQVTEHFHFFCLKKSWVAFYTSGHCPSAVWSSIHWSRYQDVTHSFPFPYLSLPIILLQVHLWLICP